MPRIRRSFDFVPTEMRLFTTLNNAIVILSGAQAEPKDSTLLVGGALAIITAFSLSLLFQSLWAGFFTAFFVAAVWLWMIDRRMVSRLEDAGNRKIVRVIFVLLISLQLGLSVIHYQRSVNHEVRLSDIRTTIIHSVSKIEMKSSLLLALRHFHSLPPEEQASIADTFKDLFDGRLNTDGTWTPETPDDGDLQYTYSIASPDSIILAVTATFTKGKDPNFINANNQTGMYQARTVLTKQGVHHVREN